MLHDKFFCRIYCRTIAGHLTVVSACPAGHLTTYFFKSQIPWGLPGGGGELIVVGFDLYINLNYNSQLLASGLVITNSYSLSREGQYELVITEPETTNCFSIKAVNFVFIGTLHFTSWSTWPIHGVNTNLRQSKFLQNTNTLQVKIVALK